MHKLIFWLRKAYVHLMVFISQLTGNPWRQVQGVYLPFRKSIGFNTLRWILNGQYEISEIEIVKKYLSKEDIVLEIGTGLGFVSTFCAKIIGDSNVYTFEANPLNVSVAAEVFKKNEVAPILKNALLGDKLGKQKFSVDVKSRLASSIHKSNIESTDVECLLLNEEIERIQPSFLVMDIEGAEYEVFKMMEFQSIKKIQVEMHPTILGDKKCNEIFDLLKANGFNAGNNPADGRNHYFFRN
jgi:FkbM family methyltransferase